ncbi:MAG: DUF5343 domain-containing protein, partial [Nitrosopumilaceae archaeon]
MSSNGEVTNGNTVDDGLPLPFGNNLEKWKFMVMGLAQLHADKNSISSKELADLTTLPESKISSNTKFLKLLKILTSESTGSKISLSQDGAKYAQALLVKDITAEKEQFTNIIKSGLNDLIVFCELHMRANDLTFDMLFNQIKLISRTKDAEGEARNTGSNYRTAIHTVIEMLVSAGILEQTYLPANNKPATTQSANTGIKKVSKRFEIPTNCQKDWLVKLFSKIKDSNPDKIDKSFIRLNVVGNNHEGSVLKIAKFLEIADKDGNHAKNYDKLRIFGSEEFKKNLIDILKEKYSKIFVNNADLETIEKGNLINFVIQEYGIGGMVAERTVNVLTLLCEMSDMKLSNSFLKTTRSTHEVKS